MAYQAPVRDYTFLVKDVLKIDQHQDVFSEVDSDTVVQILEEGAKFAEGVVAPLHRIGDQQGCKLDSETHTVTAPDGFKDAYHQMCEAGWTAMAAHTEYGGQGMPHLVNIAMNEFVSAANPAFGMYPGLTHGAYSALYAGGTDAQKDLYLPKMASGEWSGTMNLTEPHCGTDLGMLRTKAVPNGDGTYKITGQKIWISAGEHDFTSNIVHLVLARIEGAPQGVKGISLFVVPKFLPDADGNPGDRNSLHCAGLEHKMGIHGNSTCVMVYEDAKGWLVGKENEGLKVMFVMMNEARLGTGLQGLSIGAAALQAATEFAKDRIQGRSLTGPKFPAQQADPIIVHPDVRRMLLESRALIEGGRAFISWVALQNDLLHKSTDEAVRTKASDYMGLLTPIVKAYLTDRGFKVAVDSMQVHGGSGYTEHYPASQYLRDARITMIYEGTNGVQALDLVGRKLAANGGRGIMTFFGEVDGTVAELDGKDAIAPFVKGLKDAKDRLQQATMWLMQNGLANPDNAGAASLDYLHLFGQTALALMWARMAHAAQEQIDAGNTDPFYTTKLAIGRVFLERILPDSAAHLAKLTSGSDALMSLEADLI